MKPEASPIADAERAVVLDALRGFALFGIFISHVPDFSGYTFMSPSDRGALDSLGVDVLLSPTLDFLIRGKFLSLFALLFGVGFAVQLESASRRDADFVRHFSRRLAVLFVIGAAHASLWYGDILKDYALIGLALILTARWSAAGLIWAAAIIGVCRVLWPFLIAFIVPTLTESGGGADPGGDFSELTQSFAGERFAAIFSANLELLRLKALQIVYDGKAISILFMFLLGALIGKLRLYRNLRSQQGLLRMVFWICAPLGVVGNAVLVPLHAATPDYPPTAQWAIEQALFGIAVPAMTLAYVSGFGLTWSHGGEAILKLLAPAGQMALTTYVSQSLIGIGLFYGVGLGLHGDVGLAEGAMAAGGIFAVQCALSALWLRYFRFGPLEWAWRCATYGRPAPLIRRREASGAIA